jgi:hypothetical protein
MTLLHPNKRDGGIINVMKSDNEVLFLKEDIELQCMRKLFQLQLCNLNMSQSYKETPWPNLIPLSIN